MLHKSHLGMLCPMHCTLARAHRADMHHLTDVLAALAG